MRKKLDDKAEKCVFIGVNETSKAYKLFNPLTGKIVTSGDVVFDEESIWDWSRQQLNQVLHDNDVEEVLSTLENSPETTGTAAEILADIQETEDVQETEATDAVARSIRRV